MSVKRTGSDRQAYFRRTLFYLGVWFAVYGCMRWVAVASFLYDAPWNPGAVFVVLLGAANMAVGIGLMRLSRWSFWGGIALVACETVLMFLSARGLYYPLVALISALCLYYLLNRTSRSILLYGAQ